MNGGNVMIAKEFIESGILQIFHTFPENRVAAEDALQHEFAGMKLYDEPIIGIGSAEDPLFAELKQETAVGPWFMTPQEWYPDAKSVISIFFPLTEEIRESNRPSTAEPSVKWLHGRIEGQAYMVKFVGQLGQWLSRQGIGWCFPGGDSRFTGIVARTISGNTGVLRKIPSAATGQNGTLLISAAWEPLVCPRA